METLHKVISVSSKQFDFVRFLTQSGEALGDLLTLRGSKTYYTTQVALKAVVLLNYTNLSAVALNIAIKAFERALLEMSGQSIGLILTIAEVYANPVKALAKGGLNLATIKAVDCILASSEQKSKDNIFYTKAVLLAFMDWISEPSTGFMSSQTSVGCQRTVFLSSDIVFEETQCKTGSDVNIKTSLPFGFGDIYLRTSSVDTSRVIAPAGVTPLEEPSSLGRLSFSMRNWVSSGLGMLTKVTGTVSAVLLGPRRSLPFMVGALSSISPSVAESKNSSPYQHVLDLCRDPEVKKWEFNDYIARDSELIPDNVKEYIQKIESDLRANGYEVKFVDSQGGHGGNMAVLGNEKIFIAIKREMIVENFPGEYATGLAHEMSHAKLTMHGFPRGVRLSVGEGLVDRFPVWDFQDFLINEFEHALFYNSLRKLGIHPGTRSYKSLDSVKAESFNFLNMNLKSWNNVKEILRRLSMHIVECSFLPPDIPQSLLNKINQKAIAQLEKTVGDTASTMLKEVRRTFKQWIDWGRIGYIPTHDEYAQAVCKSFNILNNLSVSSPDKPISKHSVLKSCHIQIKDDVSELVMVPHERYILRKDKKEL